MTYEDRIKLILEMTGEEAVPALDKTVEELKADLEELVKSWEKNEIALGEFSVKAGQLQGQITQTESLVNGLKGTGGAGGKGSGILGVSNAVQDFGSQIERGLVPALGSIQNNIQNILPMFGAGPGLIGVITLLITGVTLLIQNWDKLSKAMGLSVEAAGASKKSLEELQKKLEDVNEALKTYKDESARGIRSQIEDREKLLKSYKDEEEAIKKVRELKTPEEEKQIKERKEALTKEFGGERFKRLEDVLLGPLRQEQLKRQAILASAEAEAKRTEEAFGKARMPFSGVGIMEQQRLENVAADALERAKAARTGMETITAAIRERQGIAAKAIETGGAPELEALRKIVAAVPGGKALMPELDRLTPDEMKAFAEALETVKNAQKEVIDSQKQLIQRAKEAEHKAKEAAHDAKEAAKLAKEKEVADIVSAQAPVLARREGVGPRFMPAFTEALKDALEKQQADKLPFDPRAAAAQAAEAIRRALGKQQRAENLDAAGPMAEQMMRMVGQEMMNQGLPLPNMAKQEEIFNMLRRRIAQGDNENAILRKAYDDAMDAIGMAAKRNGPTRNLKSVTQTLVN